MVTLSRQCSRHAQLWSSPGRWAELRRICGRRVSGRGPPWRPCRDTSCRSCPEEATTGTVLTTVRNVLWKGESHEIFKGYKWFNGESMLYSVYNVFIPLDAGDFFVSNFRKIWICYKQKKKKLCILPKNFKMFFFR